MTYPEGPATPPEGLSDDPRRLQGEIITQIPEALIAVDHGLRVTFLNPAAERHYLVQASWALGRHLSEIFRIEWFAPQDEAIAAESLALRGAWRGENIHLLHDGRKLHAENSVTVLRDAAGWEAGLLAITREVTTKRPTRVALLGSDELFQQLAENIDVVFYVADPRQDRIEYVSPAFERIWGRPTTEVYADRSTVMRGVHPDERDQVMSFARALTLQGGPAEQQYRVVRPDGSVRHIRDRAWSLSDADRGVYRVVGLAEDETERVLAHSRLAESQEALRELNRTLEARVAERTAERDRAWKNSQDLLLVLDGDGVIRAANPAWTTILGWTPEELIGRHPLDLNPAMDGGASGETLASALHDPVHSFEARVLHKEGGARWVSWVASAEGGLVYASGRHVTAEKEAAEALGRTEDLLRQSQKMEALGQLTGGISHDFNNMLQGVTSGIGLARRRIAVGRADEANRFLDAAVDAARRAANLVHRLLAFARRQPLEPRRVEVNALLEDMMGLLRQTVGPAFDITLSIVEGCWAVRCDANQLENTLLNLAINARDAMAPAGGKLRIEATHARLSGPDLAGWPSTTPGDYVRLSVVDTGVGMSPEILERVFEPFFTTKPAGQGTGLGLSQVFGFVSQSNGLVRLESQVGRGTAAHVYLPRDLESVVDDTAPLALHDGSGEEWSTGAVLLVEDDANVRYLAAEALRERGYHVLEASDGPAALEALRHAITGDRAIDILVSDVGLPGGLTGWQLAGAARELIPGLPAILITGYADEAASREHAVSRGVEVLAKPFALEALTARVRALLGAGAAP